MLGQRRRRWTYIEKALCQCIVFAGVSVNRKTSHPSRSVSPCRVSHPTPPGSQVTVTLSFSPNTYTSFRVFFILGQRLRWSPNIKPALVQYHLYVGNIASTLNQSHTRRSPRVDPMLAHRLRCWPNLNQPWMNVSCLLLEWGSRLARSKVISSSQHQSKHISTHQHSMDTSSEKIHSHIEGHPCLDLSKTISGGSRRGSGGPQCDPLSKTTRYVEPQ